MSAAKTRLTEYHGKDTVYAARITEIEPIEITGISGVCNRLIFGELGKKANLIPAWCAENNPKVGGYFVVRDGPKGSIASYMSAEEFEASYKEP